MEKPQSGHPKIFGLSVPSTFRLVDLAIFKRWPRLSCWPHRSWLTLRAEGPTLGQRKYLPIFRNKGFSTSANLESKLPVRPLMWSANSGTHRSSWICLLVRYSTQGRPEQGQDTWVVTPVTSGHVCVQRTSRRGTRGPSWGERAACTAALLFRRRVHSSCSWGDPASPSFGQFSCWPGRCDATRWVVCLV
jgi:hypothetical protein